MSAAPGRPQGSHGIDRVDEDLLGFMDRCAGKGEPTSTFYPTTGQHPHRAKAICKQCPVRQQCLDYALKYDERYGVWGGFSEAERRVIKRQQKRFAEASR